MNLGIIPAAGKASRFYGTAKELLPVGDQTCIQRAVDCMKKVCDEIVIVTNKIDTHATLSPDCLFSLQQGDGLMSAVLSGLRI
jgi:molybdopterin-guanine dinucleotide biosynthesis protein A